MNHLNNRGFFPVPGSAGRQLNTTRTTGAIGSRLISKANLGYDGAAYDPTDSIIYSYTGTRGGFLGSSREWIWQYDHYYKYQHPAGSYVYQYQDVQVFDANNNVVEVVEQEWDAITATWVNYYRSQRIYDGMNNVTGAADLYWNQVTGTWDSTTRYVFSYDGSGNLIAETAQSLAGVWSNLYRHTFTYDASDNLLTAFYEGWSSSAGTWYNHFRTTASYDGSNNKVSELGEYWDSINLEWVNSYYNTTSIFVNHQPSLLVSQFWTGLVFQNSYRYHYTYNSFDQPEYFYSDEWDTGTHAWSIKQYDYAARYHYELYTTSANSVNDLAANVAVYPVPATKEVTIDIVWDQPQAFSVTLIDIQGRMYIRHNVSACTRYKDKIATGDMSAGTYTISIESGSGKTSRIISVLK